MQTENISINGDVSFKIRFNTLHGDTDLYWRVIIDEQEYLANSVLCAVETWSDRSFDNKAQAIKYNMAGKCNRFYIDKDRKAVFI